MGKRKHRPKSRHDLILLAEGIGLALLLLIAFAALIVNSQVHPFL